MNDLITKLITGFSKGAALSVGAFLEAHNLIPGVTSEDATLFLSALVTGLLWAGVNYLEEKVKEKKDAAKNG